LAVDKWDCRFRLTNDVATSVGISPKTRPFSAFRFASFPSGVFSFFETFSLTLESKYVVYCATLQRHITSRLLGLMYHVNYFKNCQRDSKGESANYQNNSCATILLCNNNITALGIGVSLKAKTRSFGRTETSCFECRSLL